MLKKLLSEKKGYFDFDGSDINAVANQLTRWYDIEVVVSWQIKERFYAEIPRSTKLSDALGALELTGKVHFRQEGKKVVVKH